MYRIKVDTDRALGTVDPRIYGNFVEHLGRCVYGGIYDEESPRSDASGVRLDVLDAVKRLAPTTLRYPGGNFASGYHWLDGVGPKERRPRRPELAWHTVESNRFGTNEFIDYCRRVDTEPVFCLNLGTGTLDEAKDWLEYCNGTQDTFYANLRREHGCADPHGIKIWDLGNEIDGDWQIGHKSAEDYGKLALECAKLMRWLDPSVVLVACGDSFPRSDWNRVVLEILNGQADFLAIHQYLGKGDRDYEANMAHSLRFTDRRIRRAAATIESLELKRPVAIAFDEWGVSFQRGRKDGYTLEDALVVAIYLNSFIRHCRWVRMANYAQLVNVIPPITTSPDDLFLQTVFFPMETYRHQNGPVALDAWVESDTFSTPGQADVPYLDACATYDPATRRLTVNAINLHPTEPRDLRIECQNGPLAGVAEHFELAGELDDANSLAEKERVRTVRREERAIDGVLAVKLAPHSANTLVASVGE